MSKMRNVREDGEDGERGEGGMGCMQWGLRSAIEYWLSPTKTPQSQNCVETQEEQVRLSQSFLRDPTSWTETIPGRQVESESERAVNRVT
jgi:hypothetical protein